MGEALVGNEAVDQLTKFDRALRDFSSVSGASSGRGIDGMLVTKWDTVDDKVCMGGFGYLFPLIDPFVGGSCTFHDLCHWTAYYIRWMWPGMTSSVDQSRKH